jgi:hypothetical protein
MTGGMILQGRELSAGDIGLIQGLLAAHRDWGRTRLSQEPGPSFKKRVMSDE